MKRFIALNDIESGFRKLFISSYDDQAKLAPIGNGRGADAKASGGGAPELSMGSTEGRGGVTEGNGDYYG